MGYSVGRQYSPPRKTNSTLTVPLPPLWIVAGRTTRLPGQSVVGDPVSALDDPTAVHDDRIRHRVERFVECGELVPVGDDDRAVAAVQWVPVFASSLCISADHAARDRSPADSTGDEPSRRNRLRAPMEFATLFGRVSRANERGNPAAEWRWRATSRDRRSTRPGFGTSPCPSATFSSGRRAEAAVGGTPRVGVV